MRVLQLAGRSCRSAGRRDPDVYEQYRTTRQAGGCLQQQLATHVGEWIGLICASPARSRAAISWFACSARPRPSSSSASASQAAHQKSARFLTWYSSGKSIRSGGRAGPRRGEWQSPGASATWSCQSHARQPAGSAARFPEGRSRQFIGGERRTHPGEPRNRPRGRRRSASRGCSGDAPRPRSQRVSPEPPAP